MIKIYYSPLAQNDINEIWEYIHFNLDNSIAAKNMVDGILDKVEALDTNPEMETPLYFENGLYSGYRYLIYKNYMAFYRFHENTVFIDRILYAKSDFMKKLFSK